MLMPRPWRPRRRRTQRSSIKCRDCTEIVQKSSTHLRREREGAVVLVDAMTERRAGSHRLARVERVERVEQCEAFALDSGRHWS